MQPSKDRVDDESKKFLGDVKKGKPRKFVLIKDGAEIDKLYVFKKGPFERYVKMARQQGVRGEAYWGIVLGNGLDIHFELSRSDGFSTPPGPNVKLKEFLKESTDFKFEPDYVIVDVSTPIDEGAEMAVAGDAAAVQQSGTAETEAQPESIAGEDAGEKFIRLLKSILPHVKRALATSTSLSDELQTSVRLAQELGRKRDFENGMVALRRVGALTKQALAETPTAPKAQSAAPDSLASRRKEAEEKRRQQWEQRIADVEPRYSEAVQGAGPDAGKMKIVMDYAQTQSKRKQFVKALVGLDRLERMLAESS
jgi:hypothetical protein